MYHLHSRKNCTPSLEKKVLAKIDQLGWKLQVCKRIARTVWSTRWLFSTQYPHSLWSMQVAGSSYRLHETTILECCSSNQKLQVWFSDNFQDTSLAQVIKMEEQTTQPTRSARTTRTLFIKLRSSQTSPFIQLKRRIINLLRQKQQRQLMRLTTTTWLLQWLKRQLQQFNHMPEQIAILIRCYHSIHHQIRSSKIHSHCALPTLVSIWQRRLRKRRRLSTRANCPSICILKASKVLSITKEAQHRYWSRHRLN